jgi:hypothetical protein
VNGGDSELLVRASAGAGDVTVDTLTAGDSSRVNLESTADSLRLWALDHRGRQAGEGRIVRPGATRRVNLP